MKGKSWKANEVALPKLSVSAARNPVVGTCQGCGESTTLGWDDEDLGEICRECAKVTITVELMAIFPKAKWTGGAKS